MHRARVKSPKCRSAVLWTVSLAVGSLGLTGLVEPSQARTFLVPPTVYVGTGTGVTPIPIDTDAPGTPVTLGSSVWGIAITPDGKTVYANNYFAPSVVPIDVAYNTAGTSVPVGNLPRAIAITPNGQTAYVANYNDGTVTPINLATNTAGTPIPAGSHPWDWP